MGFCPKLNLYWHNKHNGLQLFYEYTDLLLAPTGALEEGILCVHVSVRACVLASVTFLKRTLKQSSKELKKGSRHK